MVTGPIPRNPKATRPKEKTAGAFMTSPSPCVLTPKAIAISATITMPIQ